MGEMMVFAFAGAFVCSNQVCIKLRENILDRWKGFAIGKKVLQARYWW